MVIIHVKNGTSNAIFIILVRLKVDSNRVFYVNNGESDCTGYTRHTTFVIESANISDVFVRLKWHLLVRDCY